MALKLIFMGTPNFAVPILQSIVKDSDHKILSVYTQPPKKSNRGQKINVSAIHKYSNSENLSVRHPENLDRKEFEYLINLKPDVVVVVAYGKIIPNFFLENKKILFINIHASLLPKWRGAAPIQRSIIEMDEETGISIMKIIPKLDAGPLLMQKKVVIQENENCETLSNKLSLLGSKLILESLDIIEKKNHKFIDQNEGLATYAKKIHKSESQINWDVKAKHLVAKINGLAPSPGAWFNHKGNRLKIINVKEANQSGKPGEVLDTKLTVACKENSIRILSIQKEGKRILSSNEFLAGYKIEKGENLSDF